MQIGIDIGATKIEYVILEDNGKEVIREREKSPTDYISTINSISKIVNKVDEKFSSKFGMVFYTFFCIYNCGLI